MINLSGIYESKPFTEITDEDWRRFYEVNVLSGVRLARAYFPGMIARDWGLRRAQDQAFRQDQHLPMAAAAVRLHCAP
jgi:NAD(P)-dependent dehydrogenase (short-subunit alcohol dehydrogenase family)